MEPLLNIIRRECARVLGLRATEQAGTVSSYDPASHSVKVLYQPENTESGWLPVGSIAVGNGFGAHFAPNIGDQVVAHFLNGEREAGIVGPRLYSTADQPLSVPAGEFWIMQSPTCGIKLQGGDAISIIGATLNATLSGAGTITVGGDLTAMIDGDLTASISGSGTITAGTLTVDGVLAVTGSITSDGTVVAVP
jgi:phage baseplate assembly protein gpV